MKPIKRSSSLEETLANNEKNVSNPGKIYTVKDVLSTKPDKIKSKKEFKHKETSVRVFKETQLKLKLLTQFIGTDHVDDLINQLIDYYLPDNMSKENKKIYLTMLEIALNQEKPLR